MGLKKEPAGKGSVTIEQRVEAPAEIVAAYILDFRNAEEWMVGVGSVERLGPDSYRLTLESPVGKLEPEVEILERAEDRIRWIYASTIEGGGEVIIEPSGGAVSPSCVVFYVGDFHLKGRVLDRAARLVGMEGFARRTGERSLMRLKHLMEARRY